MHLERDAGRTWAIVLAGGEGTRLAALTRAVHGQPVPKQFAALTGRHSMLQATLERVSRLLHPRNIVVVVCRAHLPLARAQLAQHAVTTLVQPASRGTAPAILYAASWIRARDPDAHLLVFPSDHHVAEVSRFHEAVNVARAASRELRQLTLLGVLPDAPDPEYGWILSGQHVRRACCRLEAFVEKPDAEAAHRLYEDGGLWNTLVLAAPLRVIDALARRHLPEHAASFAALDRFSFAPGATDLETLYQGLESADFSRSILEPAHDLLVVPVCGAGWSDWGTPARVLASVRGTEVERFLRDRLKSDARHVERCDADHHQPEVHHA